MMADLILRLADFAGGTVVFILGVGFCDFHNLASTVVQSAAGTGLMVFC